MFFDQNKATILFMDIRKELKILLVKEGTSMRKVVKATRGLSYDIPNESTISSELINQRIRFQTVNDILDYLGYEIVIREKQK